MGSDRIRVYKKSQSSITPGYKPKQSSFLELRYQDQEDTDTEQVAQQPQNTRPALGHSFGRMSVRPVQAKLTIGEQNDKYEQEAEREASQVVQQINAPSSAQSKQGQSVQRMEEPEEEEEIQTKAMISPLQRSLLAPALQREAMGVELERQAQTNKERSTFSPIVQRLNQPEEREQLTIPQISAIQRSLISPVLQREYLLEEEEIQAKSNIQGQEAIGGGEASTDLESAIKRARGGGQPLEEGMRESMEQLMGADFSGVRVHTDTEADQLNKSIQAKAFTMGQDLFFRQGAYEPKSRGGQELIAHELTHVVQQNGSGVKRSPSTPIHPHSVTDNTFVLAATQGSRQFIQRNRPEDFKSYEEAKKANKYSQELLDGQAKDKLEDHIGKGFTSEEIKNIYKVNKKVDNKIHSDSDGRELKRQDTSTTPHVDHRFPKAKGGTNSFRNAAVLSAKSNISKSDKTTEIKQEPSESLKPYKDLDDSNHTIEKRREFSAEQKKDIYKANINYYKKGGIISDEDGKTSLTGFDSSKVPHVDHITPKSDEGSSYYFNAQILAANENIKKGGVKKKKNSRYGWIEEQMNLREYYQYLKTNKTKIPERLSIIEYSESEDEEPKKKKRKTTKKNKN